MPIARRQARRRTRKPYHHGSLRQALLDSALEIIEERGPSALSLREAASRAGVSHAAPKRHFATVADLYCAVAEDGYRALREHLLKRVAGQPDAAPLQALAILGVAYVEFAITNPGRFRAMFHSGMTDRTASPPLEDAAGSAFDVLVGRNRAMPAGGRGPRGGAARTRAERMGDRAWARGAGSRSSARESGLQLRRSGHARARGHAATVPGAAPRARAILR